MNENSIVRELSCRLCLATDVVKLKPLTSELKRKLKKIFNITVRADDNLPKAICHDCLQEIGNIHKFSIKVDKTQNFLEFHRCKTSLPKSPDTEKPVTDAVYSPTKSETPDTDATTNNQITNNKSVIQTFVATVESVPTTANKASTITTIKQKRLKTPELKAKSKLITNQKLDKYKEVMPLEEFAEMEGVEQVHLGDRAQPKYWPQKRTKVKCDKKCLEESTSDVLDPIVLIDGRPAHTGPALDRQITFFYKMECYICKETGFHFKSLMKHYREKHGVPGYVSCCNKKFHYFQPKKIVEHMAYHLQPGIFACPSCHENFQTSNELYEHRSHGGSTDGKLQCPRCSERYPTYRELGKHLLRHRTDNSVCDYCGKTLKHPHRKKTINNMEDVILCSHCTKVLRGIEKQAREESVPVIPNRKSKKRENKENLEENSRTVII